METTTVSSVSCLTVRRCQDLLKLPVTLRKGGVALHAREEGYEGWEEVKGGIVEKGERRFRLVVPNTTHSGQK